MKKVLCFDDVLLIPKRTFGGSRNKVDISTTICNCDMKIPIFSANMSTVTGVGMSVAMYQHGGLGILHRMCSVGEQIDMLCNIEGKIAFSGYLPVFVSIEGSKKGLERIQKINHLSPEGYCLDVAHADSPDIEEIVVEIFKEYPNIKLIIGNYATGRGIYNLINAISNINLNHIAIKVGIGSGSQCTTRIVTGCGLPTFQSILDIRNDDNIPKDIKLIADGGIKNSGDIVKALAAGADAVMLGSLLAGTKESPGNVIKYKGGLYKIFRGSASFGQKFEVGKEGFVEGEETLVSYKSQVTTTLTQLIEGIKSGFSYCGALNLEELRENSEFVEITNSGYKESTPHGT
jgi:IMP dehydrogenase